VAEIVGSDAKRPNKHHLHDPLSLSVPLGLRLSLVGSLSAHASLNFSLLISTLSHSQFGLLQKIEEREKTIDGEEKGGGRVKEKEIGKKYK
jgi:hypothetical protein